MDWQPVKRASIPEIGESPPSPGRLTVTITLNQSPPSEWIRAFNDLFTATVRARSLPGWTDPMVRGDLLSYTPLESDLENSVMMMDIRIAEANAAYEREVLPKLRALEDARSRAEQAQRAHIEEARQRAEKLRPPP